MAPIRSRSPCAGRYKDVVNDACARDVGDADLKGRARGHDDVIARRPRPLRKQLEMAGFDKRTEHEAGRPGRLAASIRRMPAAVSSCRSLSLTHQVRHRIERFDRGEDEAGPR